MTDKDRARAALLPAIIAVSSAAIFIRWGEAPPLATAFWRSAIAGTAFLPVLLFPSIRSQFATQPFKKIATIAAATTIICLHQICFITSLSYTSIAASTFLTCTQPIFTAVLGTIILRERVSARSRFALSGAMIGMALITFSRSDEGNLTGNMLALAAAILAAIFSLTARKFRQTTPVVPFMLTVHWSGTVFMSVICLIFETSVIPASSQAFTALLLLGLIPTFIGHTLLNFAIGHLPAFVVSASLLGEPVGATLLGMAIMNELPPLQTIIGGIIIVSCILTVVLERELPVVPEPLRD